MSSLRWWIRATRPRTLPLSAAPTIAGIAWAWHDGSIDVLRASITLLCAVLLQVLANFVNEIGDYQRGADTAARIGPPRAVAVGAISLRAMQRVAAALSLVIVALGLWLVSQVGMWLLAVGLVALALAWLYTTGPRPLAYVSLGDAAAVTFFGIVPSAGAYAIECGTLAAEPITSGIAFGAFAAAVLTINNLRDIDSDRAAGKRTVVVRLGKRCATRYAQLLLVVPYAVALVHAVSYPLISATLVSLPLEWRVLRQLPTAQGAEYNALLGRTTLATAAYCAVLAAAIVGSRYAGQ